MRSRAQALLESYDDVITGMMQQMDAYAHNSGGYMNRMHPDQFDNEGNRRELALSEGQRYVRQRRIYRAR